MNKLVVLVTGASSGIGKATVLQLSELGFQVFAGVKDLDDVKFDHPNITPVELDVTKQSDIQNVKEKLEDKNLFALVNNAGIADFQPIELVPQDTLRRVFDINFFGPVELIQTLLPNLRRSKGRIINIGSVGAHTTIPFGFALCASKHAIKSLTDGLRLELEQDQIQVVEIDPSSIATPAAAKMVDQIHEITKTLPGSGKERYQKPLFSMGESMHKTEMKGMPPEGVAKVVAKALTIKNPKPFYSVGPNSSKITYLSKFMPAKVFDKMKLKLVGLKTG